MESKVPDLKYTGKEDPGYLDLNSQGIVLILN